VTLDVKISQFCLDLCVNFEHSKCVYVFFVHSVYYSLLLLLLSKHHDLIPARNASLAAMLGSATGSNVLYYPT
jgi:hypothetical protein